MSDTCTTLYVTKIIEHTDECSLRVINWLQDNKIIEKDRSKCLLGLEDYGYKPSTNYINVVKFDEHLLSLSVNGFQISQQKEVYNRNSFTTATKVNCPKCDAKLFEESTEADFYSESVSTEILDIYYEVQDEFENWVNGTEAILICKECKKSSLIETYLFEPKISFSNLGLYFWNWPELKSEFISALEDKLGHNLKQSLERI